MAEFVLVSALLTMLFGGVLELALTLYERNALIDCAAAGARYGVLAGNDPQSAAQRTKELIAQDLGSRAEPQVSVRSELLDGVAVLTVEVTLPVDLLGPTGAVRGITVRGHALEQGP